MFKLYPYHFCSLVLLFLLINTQHFWIHETGIFAIVLYLVELILFIGLIISTILKLYKYFDDDERNFKKGIPVFISIVVLTLVFLYPSGIITDKTIYGKDKLVAYSIGTADCSTTYYFKSNDIYIVNSFCFFPSREIGKYYLKNDTIYFDTITNKQYKFGTINRKDSILELYYLEPRTFNFDTLKVNSTIIKRKIQNSKSHSFNISEINNLE
ncbi:hypothetical protein [Empedobacter falsenii]|uniref:Uncharacterized protein n=1 Tax=Empedobacter falsenii TaxID=343874 RepID=A0A427BQ88_9FLAO|nr:hypothetical protein [Empedobacter falsenii]RRT92568.1 hypothetical protein EGI89_06040 [Empedobacter falsenii]RRT92650.1 hypothetical protein EGI88_06050 [Empedobacter falsenii]